MIKSPTFTEDHRASGRPPLTPGETTRSYKSEGNSLQGVLRMYHRCTSPYTLDACRRIRHNSSLLHFEAAPITPVQCFCGLRNSGALTVPYSRYTTRPVTATAAPRTHITSAIPTLPADLRMTLGVANILPVGR